MKYNINFSIAGLINLLMLLMFLHTQYKNEARSSSVKMAGHLIFTLFAADAFDIITAFTISYSQSVPVALNYSLNIIFYILEVFCAAFLPTYVTLLSEGKVNFKGLSVKINMSLLGIYLLMCFTTPLTRFMFYFDENKVFHTGTLHDVELFLSLYFFVFSIIKILINRSKFTRGQILSSFAFTAICVGGSFFQGVIFGWTLISFFSYSVAACFVVFGLETPDYQKLMRALSELEKNKTLLEDAQKRDAEMSRMVHKLTKTASWKLLYDNNFKLVGGDWSEEFFWMLGYEKAEVVTQGRLLTLWKESLHPDEAETVEFHFMEGLKGNAPYNSVYRLKNKQGEYRWYRGTGDVSPDVVGDGFVYSGIIQDINDEVIQDNLTKEKLAALEELEKSQAALKEAVIKAEAADRAKSDFLANMSHEIRTPINAVLGMNELISRESKDEKILEYSASVSDAGHSLLSLINDILDFSKIEAGRMEILPIQYELKGLIREVYNMINIRCANKKLSFEVICNSETPGKLLGDEIRVRQMIVNLLTNAVKYTDEGFVKLYINHEKIDADTINLIVSVKDSGIGIKPENLSLLFDEFRRLDPDKTRRREGTGLGLNITKRFAELMGGTISVESEYGKGSEFTITIPQKVVSDEIVGTLEIGSAQKKAKYEPSFAAPEAKILVVDDLITNIIVIKGLLKQTGIDIATATSGQICIEKLKSEKYDVVLLDHMMPEMDGVETMEALKAADDNLNKETPIIMLTANAILGVKEAYLKMGFSDYLSKPVKPEELEAMLVKHLPADKVHSN